jgi:hypothetical protein
MTMAIFSLDLNELLKLDDDVNFCRITVSLKRWVLLQSHKKHLKDGECVVCFHFNVISSRKNKKILSIAYEEILKLVEFGPGRWHVNTVEIQRMERSSCKCKYSSLLLART